MTDPSLWHVVWLRIREKSRGPRRREDLERVLTTERLVLKHIPSRQKFRKVVENHLWWQMEDRPNSNKRLESIFAREQTPERQVLKQMRRKQHQRSLTPKVASPHMVMIQNLNLETLLVLRTKQRSKETQDYKVLFSLRTFFAISFFTTC